MRWKNPMVVAGRTGTVSGIDHRKYRCDGAQYLLRNRSSSAKSSHNFGFFYHDGFRAELRNGFYFSGGIGTGSGTRCLYFRRRATVSRSVTLCRCTLSDGSRRNLFRRSVFSGVFFRGLCVSKRTAELCWDCLPCKHCYLA